jgi:hypothetical protein
VLTVRRCVAEGQPTHERLGRVDPRAVLWHLAVLLKAAPVPELLAERDDRAPFAGGKKERASARRPVRRRERTHLLVCMLEMLWALCALYMAICSSRSVFFSRRRPSACCIEPISFVRWICRRFLVRMS